MKIYWLCIILMLVSFAVYADESGFDERRDIYIATDGEGLSDYNGLWAYMENYENEGEYAKNQILWHVRNWGHNGPPDHNIPERDWPDDMGEGRWSPGWYLAPMQLLRVVFQYPHTISSELHWIDKNYKYFLALFPDDLSGYTLNNQLMLHTTGYLAAQKYGGDINRHRDWLFNTFEYLVREGDSSRELDSEYTKIFIESFYTLYDFAEDDTMKRAAKIMLDLTLLDSVMDVSVDLHGGHVGRTYYYTMITGGPRVYNYIYWGIEPYSSSNSGRFYSAYVSTYRIPDLIYDVGTLDDEPDEYWHWNQENNHAGHPDHLRGEGKWLYATKYYNLGGSLQGSMMNITGGIRLWLNKRDKVEPDCTGWECYLKIGEGCYQYKNAMLIPYAPNLHIVDTNTGEIYEEDTSLFDESATIGGWLFLRKDKAAVAIYSTGNVSAIEAAVIGVDYPDFTSFKTAIITKAGVSSDSFTTSKGITIRQGDRRIIVEGANDGLTLPVKRLKTDAFDGPIISWGQGTMTVSRHGKTCTYDFGGWRWNGNGCEGPPIPPPITERKTCTEWDSSAVCCESGLICSGDPYYYATDCLNGEGKTCCKGTCKFSEKDLITDFNCDNTADIQDFGILLSHWNETTDLDKYSHHECISLKNIDIESDNRINSQDFSKLFSCWAMPANTNCYE